MRRGACRGSSSSLRAGVLLVRFSNLSRSALRMASTSGEGANEISMFLRYTLHESLVTDDWLLSFQLSHHLALVNLNHERVAVFADDGADGIHKRKQGARLVRRCSEQNLESRFAHELKGAGGAGSVHFTEGFIEERKTNGIGWGRLVEAIGLCEGGGHGNIERCGGFAARFLGIDLAQERAVAVGVMDADVVLQVGAII